MSFHNEGWKAATYMLATHLISIAGVAVASQRTLATYLAVSSLPRPVFTAHSDDASPVSNVNASSIKAFISRPRVKKVLCGILGFLAALGIYAMFTGVVLALFRYASQLVIDVTFTLLLGAGFTSWIFQTVEILCSAPRTVSYKPVNPKATEKAEQSQWKIEREAAPVEGEIWTERRGKILGVSVAIAIFVMLGVASGLEFPLLVLPAVWIVPVVSNFLLPRMSMRKVAHFLMGYLMLIVVTTAIVIPLAAHFENKASEKSPEDIAKEAEEAEIEAAKWRVYSAWLQSLMSIFPYLYIIGAPGIFIALTWRFDYSLQHIAYPKCHFGTAALIPSLGSLPSFELVTAKYAFGSLIVCIICLTGTFIIDHRLGEMLSSIFGLVAVIPVMLLATSFGAWRNGVLREWWNYTETWIPTIDDEEHSADSVDNAFPHGEGEKAIKA